MRTVQPGIFALFLFQLVALGFTSPQAQAHDQVFHADTTLYMDTDDARLIGSPVKIDVGERIRHAKLDIGLMTFWDGLYAAGVTAGILGSDGAFATALMLGSTPFGLVSTGLVTCDLTCTAYRFPKKSLPDLQAFMKTPAYQAMLSAPYKKSCEEIALLLFSSLSDAELISMTIKEGKHADRAKVNLLAARMELRRIQSNRAQAMTAVEQVSTSQASQKAATSASSGSGIQGSAASVTSAQ